MEHPRRAAVLGVLALAVAAVLHLVGPHGIGAAGHHGVTSPSEASAVLVDHSAPTSQDHSEHVHAGGPEAHTGLVDHSEPTGQDQGEYLHAAGDEAHSDIHSECWIRTHDHAGDFEFSAPPVCVPDSFRAIAPDHLTVHPGRPPTSAVAVPDLLAELGISRT